VRVQIIAVPMQVAAVPMKLVDVVPKLVALQFANAVSAKLVNVIVMLSAMTVQVGAAMPLQFITVTMVVFAGNVMAQVWPVVMRV
jgi:hypothetical protein